MGLKISSKSSSPTNPFLKDMDEINDLIQSMGQDTCDKIPVLKHIYEHGAENIFILYKSGYDTMYYDNITNEKFLSISLGTKAKLVYIEDALDDDYINRTPLYNNLYKEEKQKIDKLEFMFENIKIFNE